MHSNYTGNRVYSSESPNHLSVFVSVRFWWKVEQVVLIAVNINFKRCQFMHIFHVLFGGRTFVFWSKRDVCWINYLVLYDFWHLVIMWNSKNKYQRQMFPVKKSDHTQTHQLHQFYVNLSWNLLTIKRKSTCTLYMDSFDHKSKEYISHKTFMIWCYSFEICITI